MARLDAIAVAVVVALSGCAKSGHAPGGPYYFDSFASYEVPFRPIGELSAFDAKAREPQGIAVYAAWFNERGQILRVEKYYRGVIQMRVEYTYRDAKLIEEKGIDQDGKAFAKSHE